MMFIPHPPPVNYGHVVPVLENWADREALIVEQQAIQRGSVLLPNTNGLFASSFNKPPTTTLTNIGGGKTDYVSDLFPNQSPSSGDRQNNQRCNSKPATMTTIGRPGVHGVYGVNTGNTFSAWG
jgi:hypothetical protein